MQCNAMTPTLDCRCCFDWDASCPKDVVPKSNADTHGTAVASIVAAVGNNGECAVGIAPQATLSACNALVTGESFLASI